MRSALAQSTISKLETGTLRGMRYTTLLRVLAALDAVSMIIEVDRPSWYAELISRYDRPGYDREGNSADG